MSGIFAHSSWLDGRALNRATGLQVWTLWDVWPPGLRKWFFSVARRSAFAWMSPTMGKGGTQIRDLSSEDRILAANARQAEDRRPAGSCGRSGLVSALHTEGLFRHGGFSGAASTGRGLMSMVSARVAPTWHLLIG